MQESVRFSSNLRRWCPRAPSLAAQFTLCPRAPSPPGDLLSPVGDSPCLAAQFTLCPRAEGEEWDIPRGSSGGPSPPGDLLSPVGDSPCLAAQFTLHPAPGDLLSPDGHAQVLRKAGAACARKNYWNLHPFSHHTRNDCLNQTDSQRNDT